MTAPHAAAAAVAAAADWAAGAADWAAATFDWLGQDDGRLWVWGAYTRGVGVMLSFSLLGLAWNAVPLAGKKGLIPARATFAAHWRDFGARALWYWPSLFWLVGTSDAALTLLPLAGAAAGLAAAAGWHSQAALALAWAALLSVDNGVLAAVYPWDSLLLESASLALFLPPLPALGSGVAASALPAPALAWAFRWLLARLLLGFGKLKFMGSGWRDRRYIKAFLTAQPIPSPAGYAAFQLLPDAAHPALLAGMWVTEIPLPLIALATTGAPRAAAGLAIMGLMAGIQLTGNFGYFNVLTIVASLPLLDHVGAVTLGAGWRGNLLPPGSAAALPEALAAAWQHAGGPTAALAAVAGVAASHWRELVLPAYLLSAWLPLSLLQFVMNSWINLGWAHFSSIYRLRLALPLRWSQWYAALLRDVLQQWRAIAAYGVFPPMTGPFGRTVVAMEGSRDGGRTWTRYRYRFLPCAPDSAPAVVAPYHPRLDHLTFYHSGATGNLAANLLAADPYEYFASASPWVRLQAALLRRDGAGGVRRLLAPGQDALLRSPPEQVRGVLLALLPARSLAGAVTTGAYWQETLLGVVQPPLSLAACGAQSAHPTVPRNTGEEQKQGAGGASAAADDGDAPPLWPLSDAAGSGPEDFWPEFVFWRRRAGHTTGVITPADYEAAWAFVDDLRRAAAHAAAAAAASAARSGGTPFGFVSAATAAASSRAPVTSPEDPALPPAAVDVLERTRLRLEPNWAAVADAARAVLAAVDGAAGSNSKEGASRSRSRSRSRGASISGSRRSGSASPARKAAAAAGGATASARLPGAAALPVAAAHEVFVWSFLPDAFAAVRARYTASELVAARRTLARMGLPLMLACEALFDHQPATATFTAADGERAAATFAAVAGGATVPDADFSAAVDVALGGHGLVRDPTLPSPSSGIAPATPDGYPVYVFTGNGGAEAGFTPGRMGGPFGWWAHVNYLLLVGGRAAYERAAAAALAPSGSGATSHPRDFLLGRQLPTAAAGTAAAPLRAAHPQALLRALSIGGVVVPGAAPTEAALLLQMAASYNTWSTNAVASHRAAAQGRPSRERAALPHFLPNALALSHRMQAHPGLRRVYDDCGLSLQRDADGFLPPPRVLRWQPCGDETQWIPRGLHVDGQALAAVAGAGALTTAATQQQPTPAADRHLLVLYDGVCRLCNSVVGFLLRRDPDGSRFRFAAIQSRPGAAALRAAGIPLEEALDSFTVVDTATGASYRKSTAALVVAAALPGRGYGAAAVVGTLLLPRVLRDAAYDVVAALRYRVFGRLDDGRDTADDAVGCLPATPGVLRRFLDADEIREELRARSAAARAAKAAAKAGSSSKGE